MVIHEPYGIDDHGRTVIRSYSDRNMMIEYDGKRYISAYDTENDVKDYIETDEPVEE